MVRFTTQVRCHVCTPGHQLHGMKPNDELDQPSFSAHPIELSPLCDEVSWRVHFRYVAFVHDDHSVKQQKDGFQVQHLSVHLIYYAMCEINLWVLWSAGL